MRLVATLIALVLFALPSAAQGTRVALVIGNSAYQHTPKLTNPKNDANDVSTGLKKHGFQVIEGYDLDKAAFDRKIRDFANALQGAGEGLLFYAGHGLQVAGHNYLVPVDAQLTTAAALEFEMVRLDVVHRVMERQANTNVLFLDACRDNPLARNLARAMGTRSSEIGRGLAAVESGVGTLISFSTQPGNVALDGAGRNSPFAGALVKQIAASNDDLSAILIAVRNDVTKQTQRKQVPWEHSALTGKFYFGAAPALAPQVAPPPASARLSEAGEAWDRTKDSTSVAVLEAFIARFKETFYAELARARIDELKKKEVAVAPPPRTVPQTEPTIPTILEAPSRGEVRRFCKSVAINPSIAAVQALLETYKGTPMADCAQARLDELKRADAAPMKPRVPPAAAPCGGIELSVANEKRCVKPKDSFKDCADCPEMVVVPAGNFSMGSRDGLSDEKPAHRVTFRRPFAMGKFEVTFAEWEACVAEKACASTGDEGWGRGRRPVINVTWRAATDYAAWLNAKTSRNYRLLTEAEWEYAARAGTTTAYSFGDAISEKQAHYSPSNLNRRRQTVEVGSFQPNGFGLHDMHGNASEWVADNLHPDYENAPQDGSIWAGGNPGISMVRGGSWNDDANAVRSAFRGRLRTAGQTPFVGLRVARTLD